ncbi:leucine-rich repeat protein [Prevotella sp. AGR2160]|uniref:leucine-rich repeat protein n=1 Tax=Prevotella sp. AGR2160 TaxID=1280674 RepID=UPI0018C91652|nr:leucine-rich repeat protein [Prevotella sp. AGR2160]
MRDNSDTTTILLSKDGKELLSYNSNLKNTEYTIPEGVETIRNQAFSGAWKLRKVNIPASVKSMSMPFRGTNITEINFEDTQDKPSKLKTLNLRDIGAKIVTLTLPRSLETINNEAVTTSTLNTIIIPDGSNLCTLNANCFKDAKNIKEFRFEGSCKLKTIGVNVFSYKTSLESFNVPASVTSIERGAFMGCSSLKTVTFDDNSQLETIGAGAFAACGIESINVPSTVKTIDREAFRDCQALKEVHLSAQTTYVSPEAFKHCDKLTKITVDEDNPVYSSVMGMLFDKSKTTLLIFPPGQAQKDLVVLPPSVTAIGDYAFYDCPNLTNVVIPRKVKKIGKRAFGLDTNLKSIAFLCDSVINTDSIAQGMNEMAFDNGTQAADNLFNHVTIYVRANNASDYNKSPFFKQFKAAKSEFKTTYNEGSRTYDETYMPLSDNSVQLVSTKADVSTYVLNKVKTTENGTVVERKVNMIGDYAFEGANVKTVVCKQNIASIGAMAFVTKTKTVTENGKDVVKPVDTTIKNIFFCDSVPASELSSKVFLLNKDFSEFQGSQTIYVKPSAEQTYKEAWPDYASLINTKIPAPELGKFNTFSCEFATDFSACIDSLKSKGVDMAAYYATPGNASKLTLHLVKVGEGKEVPAGTGVLFAAKNSASSLKNLYYTISENEGKTTSTHTSKAPAASAAASSNIFQPVMVDTTVVNTKGLYVLDGNYLKKVTTQKLAPNKAYALLPNSTSEKLKLVFNELGDVNGDGILDVTDASGIVGKTLGKPSSNYDSDVADYNEDSVIDITDASTIESNYLGK